MYCATGSDAFATRGTKRGKRDDDDVSVHADLGPALKRRWPETAILDQLSSLDKQVSSSLSKSMQRWSSYFGRKRDTDSGQVVRTLQVCVFSTKNDTSPQSWTLRIEGKLLGDTADSDVLFSHFIKKVTIELDQGLFKNDWFVEWDNRRHIGETRGFQITREGNTECLAKVCIEIDYLVPLYMVTNPMLVDVLGMDGDKSRIDYAMDTFDHILYKLWVYCSHHQLQVKDTMIFACNKPLQQIFQVAQFEIKDLPTLVQAHLKLPDAIRVEYPIRLDAHRGEKKIFLVPVQDPPVVLQDKHEQSVKEIDDKIEEVFAQILVHEKRRAALLKMAKDPSKFLTTMLRSDVRDINLLQSVEDIDAQSRSEYFQSPYVADSANQYLKMKSLE